MSKVKYNLFVDYKLLLSFLSISVILVVIRIFMNINGYKVHVTYDIETQRSFAKTITKTA